MIKQIVLFTTLLFAGAFGQAASKDTLKAQADSLYKLGNGLINAGKYDSAQVAFQSEVKIREALLDSVGLANGLNSLCRALGLGSKFFEEELATGERALSICKFTVGENDTLAARSLNIIGVCLSRTWRLSQKALEYYNKALTIRLKALGPEHPDVAQSYFNIGNVYYDLVNYEKALEYYHKALTIRLKALGPDHPDVALSYNDIGEVYLQLGDYEKALEYYNKALTIRLKAFGLDHPDVAQSYINIGDIYCNLADYEQALGYFNKALAILLKALGPENLYVSYSYGNIGTIYFNLGDYEKMLECDNKALAIQLKALGPDHPDVAQSYINIGSDYYTLGEYEKALGYFNKSFAIQLKALGPEHPSVATNYNNIGAVYLKLGDYEKASENYNKALVICLKALGPDHPDVAQIFNNSGMVYYALGDYEKALENYNKAIAIWLKSLGPDHPDVAYSYYNISKVFRIRKDFATALDYLKKSIEIAEKVRGNVSSEELKKTYTESVRNYYDEIVTLLMEMGRPKEAFEYYERSKSKLLQDELNKEGVEIGQGEVRKKLGEVKSLGLQVGVLEKQVIDEQSKPKPEQNKTKIENLTKLLAQTKGEFYQLVSEIKQNPTFAFTVDINPVAFSAIQKNLSPGTKVVMYYEAKDMLYIFLLTRDNYLAKSVAVSKDSLDALVKRFRQAIDTTHIETGPVEDTGLKNTLTNLYQYLIEPIEQELSQATEITIIPSGNLYYLPFEALAHDDGTKLKYLLEGPPISYLTQAELISYAQGKTKADPSGSPDLLLVGDPTGADLPAAADEAKAIHTLYPRSKLYLDADATKTMVEREAPLTQILHLATHAFPDPKNPWESYIYLTKAGEDNGHWTMSEVTNETWDKMALVILSACETAIGGDKPGLEMESMARAFSIAGAPSIVATLWPVYSSSTKDLMVAFYSNLKSMSKVNALRQAQLSLLQNPKYSQPFFWAPFILIGEWR